MEYTEKAQYFGGTHYLERMDSLLRAFNEAHVNDDVDLMLNLIHAYFQEVSPYMKQNSTVNEKDEHINKFNEAMNLFQKYNEEINHNISKQKLKQRNPHQKVFFESVMKIKLKLFLCNWRMELQKLAKDRGLIMQDQENAGTALQRGLSE